MNNLKTENKHGHNDRTCQMNCSTICGECEISNDKEEQLDLELNNLKLNPKYNSQYQFAYAIEKLCSPVLDVSNYIKPLNWDEELWNYMITKPYNERVILVSKLIYAEIERLKIK